MLQGQDWQEENSSTRLNWLTRPAHCNNTVIDIITLFPCLSVKQLVLPKISYLRKMSSQSKNRNCTCVCKFIFTCLHMSSCASPRFDFPWYFPWCFSIEVDFFFHGVVDLLFVTDHHLKRTVDLAQKSDMLKIQRCKCPNACTMSIKIGKKCNFKYVFGDTARNFRPPTHTQKKIT